MNGGELKRLPNRLYFGKDVDPNTRANIYTTMYAQVAKDFANTPRPKEITVDELRFYYDLLVPELIQYQKDKMRNGR